MVDFEICNWQSKLLTLAISEVFVKEAPSIKTEVNDMSDIVQKQTFLKSAFLHFILFLNGESSKQHHELHFIDDVDF